MLRIAGKCIVNNFSMTPFYSVAVRKTKTKMRGNIIYSNQANLQKKLIIVIKAILRIIFNVD
jgi:hypothetical protein